MSTFTFFLTWLMKIMVPQMSFFSPTDINSVKGAGDAAQLLEGLPSMCKALEST